MMRLREMSVVVCVTILLSFLPQGKVIRNLGKLSFPIIKFMECMENLYVNFSTSRQTVKICKISVVVMGKLECVKFSLYFPNIYELEMFWPI